MGKILPDRVVRVRVRPGALPPSRPGRGALLAGCSGDDGASPTGGSAPASFTKDCTVTVKVTGAVKSSWRGNGTVTDGGGPTTYTATDPGAGLDIAKDGSRAEIDADTVGVDGAGPHLVARFTCGE